MIIVEVVFPIFAIALLGYVVAYKGIFDMRDIEGISRYVFNIAIPVMLFEAMADLDFPEVIDFNFLLAYYFVAVAMFALGMALSRRWFNYARPERTIFGMGTCYSNAVLIGLPLISSGLGEAALLPTFMLISVHSAIIFFLVTLFAEYNDGVSQSPLGIGQQTLVSLAKNPIIIGLLLGLLANLLAIPIPQVVASTADIIGRSALPSALFVLGASLSVYKLAGKLRAAWAIVGLKMVLQPLLVWFLAFVIFQIDPLWGAVAVMMAAMPVGINVYIFAQKYQVCLAPVSSAIVISTTLALITQSILLAIFI